MADNGGRHSSVGGRRARAGRDSARAGLVTTTSQPPALGGFVVKRTAAGGWQLEDEDIGYLMPLTWPEVRAFLAGRYDVDELRRGRLVEKAKGKHGQ